MTVHGHQFSFQVFIRASWLGFHSVTIRLSEKQTQELFTGYLPMYKTKLEVLNIILLQKMSI